MLKVASFTCWCISCCTSSSKTFAVASGKACVLTLPKAGVAHIAQTEDEKGGHAEDVGAAVHVAAVDALVALVAEGHEKGSLSDDVGAAVHGAAADALVALMTEGDIVST